MLHVFHGEDDFSIAEEVRRLEDAVGPRDALDANRSRLAGQGLDLRTLRGVCDAIPFLADRRLVVVEGLLAQASRRRGGRQRAAQRPDATAGEDESAEAGGGKWEGLPEYVTEMPPTTDLVLVERGKVETTGLLRRLTELARKRPDVARVRAFPALRREELARWVRNRATSHGAALSPGAVTLLVDLIGPNLWILDSELEKLALHAGGEVVQPEHVRRMVAQAREESVFNAVDAALEGRIAAAAPQMERLLQSGATFPYLVSMLERQLRMTVQVKALLERRAPESAIGEQVGLRGFPLRKTMDQAKKASWPRLRWAYARLAAADLEVKRGRLREPIALSVLLAELGPRA